MEENRDQGIDSATETIPEEEGAEVLLLDQYSYLLLFISAVFLLWFIGFCGGQRRQAPQFTDRDVVNVFEGYERAMKATKEHEAEKKKRMGFTKSD